MRHEFSPGLLIADALGLVLLCTVSAASAAAAYDLSWDSVAGGGASLTTGGNYALDATIGQAATGPSSGAGRALYAGFWAVTGIPVPTPALQGVVSRKTHGGAGPFDLALALTPANPTTEPRAGGAGGSHVVVFTFDRAVTGAAVSVPEGTASAGAPTYSGNDVVVGLSGVGNAQYVTVSLAGVASGDGGAGGSGSVRIGFLAGDVNGTRSVTLSDVLGVNAVLAQLVTATNYLRDVNASGTLTLADKFLVNSRLTQSLPAPP